MVYGCHIYLIIFCMSAKPFNLNGPVVKNYAYNQPVFIPHNVEYNSIVSNNTYCFINSLQLIEICKILFYEFCIPLL